jgi:hypothetical protein
LDLDFQLQISYHINYGIIYVAYGMLGGLMSFSTKKGQLAIKQPDFTKIEAQVKGGIALISQRINLIEVPLLMDYELDGTKLKAKETMIILRGDAGVQPWAKQVFSLVSSEESFVLCPESQVIGFRTL